TIIYLIAIFGIVIAAVVITNQTRTESQEFSSQNPPHTNSPTETQATVSDEEKQQIERWITDNGLNFYGDPENTIYTGGTPLFDEATGKTLDRFEYIINRHPDTPWRR